MKTRKVIQFMMVAMALAAVTFTACKKDEDEDPNTAPTVQITSPTDGQFIEMGNNVTVTITAADADNNLATVIVYLNDNVVKTFTEGPYEYSFSTQGAAYGEHIIKAEAVDTKQANAEDMVTISLATTPIAGFTSNRVAGLAGRSLTFEDQSENDPTEWLWDFGDGNTSIEQNPTHVYAQAGTYTVSLTATNGAGNSTETKTDYLTIFPIDMIELVTVDGGTFEMGSDDDGWDETSPVHSVTLDEFLIGKYEITNEQYANFLNVINAESNGDVDGVKYISIGDTFCEIEYNGESFQVIAGKELVAAAEITWYGAKAFCDYYGYNLPTEAQWEFAARGGINEIKTTYAGSNDLTEVGWYGLNANDIMEVGLLSPNELGAFDMSGNAREWCQDWYDENYYGNSPSINPTGPSSGGQKTLRGGSAGVQSQECTVYSRADISPDSHNTFGFRVALLNE